MNEFKKRLKGLYVLLEILAFASALVSALTFISLKLEDISYL